MRKWVDALIEGMELITVVVSCAVAASIAATFAAIHTYYNLPEVEVVTEDEDPDPPPSGKPDLKAVN